MKTLLLLFIALAAQLHGEVTGPAVLLRGLNGPPPAGSCASVGNTKKAPIVDQTAVPTVMYACRQTSVGVFEWVDIGTASVTGLTSFGTLTAGTQLLTIGTAGTAPAWAVSGLDTHVLNIPMAATVSVTAGLLSKAQYDAFAAKLDPAGTAALATALAGGSSGQVPYQSGAGVTAFSDAFTFTTANSGFLGLKGGFTAGQSGVATGRYIINGTTSGSLTLTAPAAAGTNSSITFPAGVVDFSATGGTSQVVKQTSAGAPFTVARLACADLSDSGAGCTGAGSGGSAPTAPISQSFAANATSVTVTHNYGFKAELDCYIGDADASVQFLGFSTPTKTTTASTATMSNDHAAGFCIAQANGGIANSWGTITGTLSSQADLQSALDLKSPLISPLFTTPTLGAAVATSVAFGADPGDAQPLRLSNNTGLAWEAATPGTDLTFLLNSSNEFIASAHLNVPSEAYDATGWNGDTTVPQKDAVRDALVLLAPLVSPSFTTPNIGAASGASLDLTGGLTTGGATPGECGGGTAGCIQVGQGTAPSAQGTNAIQWIAPASVTSYRFVPPSAAGDGVLLHSNSSNVVTQSFVASLGTGPFIRSAGGLAVASGKTFTVSNSMTQTATDGSTVEFGVGGTATYTIASGTKALDTDAIASTACDTLSTTTATGVASTDVILITPNADITAVTGYTAATTGGLQIMFWPTTNTLNWKICNPTSSSITPGAVTLNYRVVR